MGFGKILTEIPSLPSSTIPVFKCPQALVLFPPIHLAIYTILSPSIDQKPPPTYNSPLYTSIAAMPLSKFPTLHQSVPSYLARYGVEIPPAIVNCPPTQSAP